MQQLINVWTALDPRRRVVVILAALAIITTVTAMSRIVAAPTMTLLYAGLESGAAGEVVRALEQRGISYEVRGGAIFSEAARRDELRMTLASEGLPANSGEGYELLDALSGFGTTSQMFDAAYWRAKEGELARTIMTSQHISAARVHIANTSSNPFQREVRPTASVSVSAASDAITSVHAKALKFLVASAVAGLAPEDVAVIDVAGNLIGATEDAAPNIAGDDRSSVLRERVKRLLEARVGFGNAVVEVSVETVTQSESVRERSFDPSSRVVVSSDTEESSNNSTDAGGGDVTVASNLPSGDGSSSDGSSSSNTETRERVNYEVSETEREIVRGPGAVRRMTVAVLINGITQLDASGVEVFVSRSEEELSTLKELVSSAVGFDEDRGDVITLKSLEFRPLEPLGTSGTSSVMDSLNLDLMSIIQMGVLAVVSLILGLFVLRPILSKEPIAALAELPPLETTGGSLGDTESLANMPLPPLTGEISEGGFDLPDLPVISGFDGGGAFPEMGGMGSGTDDPVDRLRSLIGERQEETVEILRGWLEDEEETA